VIRYARYSLRDEDEELLNAFERVIYGAAVEHLANIEYWSEARRDLQHYHPDARVESLAESWSRTEGACRFLREQIESVTRYLTVLLDDHESVALLGLQLLGVADLLTQAVRELIVLERTEPVGDVVEDCDEKAEDLDEKADTGLLGGNQPE